LEEWSATKGNRINKGCNNNACRETRKTIQLPSARILSFTTE
jgi:hypothetical protein